VDDQLRNQPTQPASILYDGDSGLTAYERPGALVISGRKNFADPGFRRVSAAGGSVLIYLNPVIDNSFGRYQTLMLERSACGPAVPRWPGNPRSDLYGHLLDFRVGSVIQRKLECVLEAAVRENPHMAGWFADDVGTRSYYSGVNWDTWSRSDKDAYRDGAIALTQTLRKVADRYGLMVMVNGSWNGGAPELVGGGYPDPQQSGTSLADGGMIENHEANLSFMIDYSCSKQWATSSPLTRGKAFHYATTRTVAGRSGFASRACVAFAGTQERYDVASPAWTSFHPTGLPSAVHE
jgi:hypothetical protein